MSGLRLLPPDDRDFSLGAYIPLPPLESIPRSFSLTPLDIKDQGPTDFCTAFATCGASELQEGVRLCPEFTFAMTKKIEGDYTTWGADLRTACKSHVQYGALEFDDAPFTLETRSQEFLRNPDVWPKLSMERAAIHKKQTYFKVTGPYDHFDNIRASLWHFRDKKQAAILGVEYGWPSTQVYMDSLEGGSGHCMYAVGFEGEYLQVINSYGEDTGRFGVVYLRREVVNDGVEKYGAFMLTDIPRDAVEPVDELQQLTNRILDFLTGLFVKRAGGQGFYPLQPWVRRAWSIFPKSTQLSFYAKLSLGLDLSSIAPDKLGCAESVTRILNMLWPGIVPVTQSTIELDKYLNSSNAFYLTDTPRSGNIILAVTVGENHGHAGVVVGDVVFSNNSRTGKWDRHMSVRMFLDYYRKMKLQIKFYSLK